MKRISTLLLLVACVVMAQAQKLDAQLMQLVGQSATRGEHVVTNQKVLQDKLCANLNADGSIQSVPVIGYLQRGAECPVEVLKAKGIEVKRVIDNMVSMVVPVEQLMAFEDIDEFILIIPMTKADIYNKEAAASSKASVVNTAASATAAGLPRNYTGKGVVVGIIDRGIDYNHQAFYDAQGKTRVVKIINTPDNNKEVTEESEIVKMTTDLTNNSHGTHTSATAVGSELGNGLHGVATEADIILVGTGALGTDDNICNGIEKIFEYADSKNKPAVINISMGTGSNLHDGSSLICKTVNKLTQNGSKPGRVVVMSAGNLADNKQSVLAKLGTADTDGWQLKTVLGSDVIMSEPDDLPFYKMPEVFAYADDGKDFTMELKAVNIETGEVTDAESQILASPISGVKYIPQVVKGERINIKDEKVVINEIVATDAFFLKNQKFRLALFVKGTAGQTIKLFRGNNNVAEWCFYAPDKLTGYTDGSSDFTFNADACTDAVISVGAYTTATEWQDYYDMTKGYRPSKITGKEQVLGEIADFSSYGVDDNGKNRPTVIAPGQGLLSAINLYDETSFDATGEPKTGEDSNTAHICPRSMMIEKGGRKNWYGHKEGTSMSSPHVAGIIALWLEANPNLSALQIADIIKETSVKDEFCTDISKIPGHNLVQAGAGKIDAVAGMKKVLELTGIRTVDADKRQDADAPVYNLMGQKVERSHRGIVISNGRKYVKK